MPRPRGLISFSGMCLWRQRPQPGGPGACGSSLPEIGSDSFGAERDVSGEAAMGNKSTTELTQGSLKQNSGSERMKPSWDGAGQSGSRAETVHSIETPNARQKFPDRHQCRGPAAC